MLNIVYALIVKQPNTFMGGTKNVQNFSKAKEKIMNGSGLKKFRESLKLTQREFYFQLGFFPSYGNNIEKGFMKRPIPRKLLEQIEKKYNLGRVKK